MHFTANMRCFLLALCLAPLVCALPLSNSSNASTATTNTWTVQQFSSLITFGDSYTDENRLNYFYAHNGNPPPSGTMLPEARPSCRKASGAQR